MGISTLRACRNGALVEPSNRMHRSRVSVKTRQPRLQSWLALRTAKRLQRYGRGGGVGRGRVVGVALGDPIGVGVGVLQGLGLHSAVGVGVAAIVAVGLAVEVFGNCASGGAHGRGF